METSVLYLSRLKKVKAADRMPRVAPAMRPYRLTASMQRFHGYAASYCPVRRKVLPGAHAKGLELLNPSARPLVPLRKMRGIIVLPGLRVTDPLWMLVPSK